MTFISFSCLIVLVRTSSTMLNVSGKHIPPCVTTGLKEKAFSLAVGLSHMTFIFFFQNTFY